MCCINTVLCIPSGTDVDKTLFLQGHKVKVVLSRPQMLCWAILKSRKQLRDRRNQGEVCEKIKGLHSSHGDRLVGLFTCRPTLGSGTVPRPLQLFLPLWCHLTAGHPKWPSLTCATFYEGGIWYHSDVSCSKNGVYLLLLKGVVEEYLAS